VVCQDSMEQDREARGRYPDVAKDTAPSGCLSRGSWPTATLGSRVVPCAWVRRPLRLGLVPASPAGRLRRRSADVRSDMGEAAAPAVGEASSTLIGSSMARMKRPEVAAVDVSLILVERR
jgi:hypothetical protein